MFAMQQLVRRDDAGGQIHICSICTEPFADLPALRYFLKPSITRHCAVVKVIDAGKDSQHVKILIHFALSGNRIMHNHTGDVTRCW